MLKKKILQTIFVISLLFLLVSCSSKVASITPDSIPFKFLTEVNVGENERIKIYELENVNNVYYRYYELDKPDSSSWIINYMYSYDYYVDKEVPDYIYNPFYSAINNSLLRISESYSFDFNTNENGSTEEREIIINDINSEDEIILIDMYIPYKVTHLTSSKDYMYVIMVPVATFTAFRSNDQIRFNGITMNYQTFISNSNIIK